jgi:thioredoxin reductase (NADPH)
VFDIVIAGAGPAGLAAGYYSAFFGLRTLLLEAGKRTGGRMLKARRMGNYLGLPEEIAGRELAERMTTQAKGAGAELHTSEKVVGVSCSREIVVETDRDVYCSNALILATGAGMKGLGLDGETWIGDGISYCYQCDAYMMEDMDLIVIGDTERAVDEALCLSRIGNEVRLVNHANKIWIGAKEKDELRKNGVELVEGFVGKAVSGKPPQMQLILRSARNSSTKKLEANLVCVVSPSAPFISVLQKAGIATHPAGCIAVDQFGRTNIKGIFAAGSCASTTKDIVPVCVGDGTMVAVHTCLYVKNEKR